MDKQAVFYQLGRKFVDDAREIPEESADVLYYTLAVGHHTGVIDCFEEVLRCPMAVYEGVCKLLPAGDARYKLEGILRSGEIQVDKTHVEKLDEPVRAAIDALHESGVSVEDGDDSTLQAQELAWLQGFDAALDAIKRDPVVYLMGRERDA